MKWLFFGSSLGVYINGYIQTVTEHQFALAQWSLTLVFLGIGIILHRLEGLK